MFDARLMALLEAAPYERRCWQQLRQQSAAIRRYMRAARSCVDFSCYFFYAATRYAIVCCLLMVLSFTRCLMREDITRRDTTRLYHYEC